MGWTCGDEQAHANLRHSQLQKPKIIKSAKMTVVVQISVPLPFSNILSVYLHPGCGSLHAARAVVLFSVEMMLSPPLGRKVLKAGTTWSTDVRSLVASFGERHAKRKKTFGLMQVIGLRLGSRI